MNIRILIYLFVFGITASVRAEPIILNCEKDEASTNNYFQLTINIDNRLIALGDTEYEIIQINDDFILAVETSIKSGNSGEAISLNRKTGRFRWASIDAGTPAERVSPYKPYFATTNEGNCKRPII